MNHVTGSVSPFLRINGLAKAFYGNVVLKDINLEVEAGEIVGLLGPNGSGKSTLLNTLTGFESMDSGSVIFQGNALGTKSSHQIMKSGIARTFQLPTMPTKMSVLEVAMCAHTAHHGLWETLRNTASVRESEAQAKKKADRLLGELLLDGVRDLPAASLSGGQKKLLGIVCALMGSPALLMLDEPTAGVHPNLRTDIVQTLKRINTEGITLIIVEHDMHFIRDVCSRCVVLDRGKIVASCVPDELANNEHVVSAYLGMPTHSLAVEACA